ncbi:SDR family oxidoreductase [Sphingomonas sp. KR1UV-12]|uniref:SDR family oxidoreductase n=1 Tax=Sphingomonas aurea TaxID=3063994 RepID=A0ABT9ELE6_9SPHN|nr:SDR family oxidoreductase [Sphingomonas sp. KR1UV-12]MDP1027616.1 SDR family oxidoreductase [Sphingomonas sp. KR1UV-12]
MAGELTGRVAIVTGASRGLGRAIAELFVAEGARVAVLDLKQPWAAAVADEINAKGGQAIGLGCDVGDREAVHAAVQATLDAFGQLDILVNNAMWNRYEPVETITTETFERMTRVGMGGIVWGIQAATPAMRARGGSIVNIGSMAGRLGSPNALIYAGVKAGVDGLTRAASIELGRDNIRVNAIAPSTVATEGVLAMLSDEMMARRLERSPMGRLGETGDIAQTALWLASDRSGFVNGQSIAVDGGIGHAFMP